MIRWVLQQVAEAEGEFGLWQGSPAPGDGGRGRLSALSPEQTWRGVHWALRESPSLVRPLGGWQSDTVSGRARVTAATQSRVGSRPLGMKFKVPSSPPEALSKPALLGPPFPGLSSLSPRTVCTEVPSRDFVWPPMLTQVTLMPFSLLSLILAIHTCPEKFSLCVKGHSQQ